jgi:hypothetical protein
MIEGSLTKAAVAPDLPAVAGMTWVSIGRRESGIRLTARLPHQCEMKSPHLCTLVSVVPHGMIGTEDVEFFGDPSISRSE